MRKKVREVNPRDLDVTTNHRHHDTGVFSEAARRKGTHGLSLPPVTISPSRRVVYMANTGPL